MKITWEEAYQIAGEIVDKLTQAGIKVVFAGEEPMPDEVEHIASIICEKDHQTWSNHHQEWVCYKGRKNKVRYIEAPTDLSSVYTGGLRSMFLAGGITGCPDWQQEMRALLSDTNLVLLNPRRADFPIHDPQAAEQQITWEHRHLKLATAILFWFPCETICPIVLYELGAWSMKAKPIFVGVHPDYQRRQDVEIQTRLVRPDVEIVYSLSDLAQQVKKWAE